MSLERFKEKLRRALNVRMAVLTEWFAKMTTHERKQYLSNMSEHRLLNWRRELEHREAQRAFTAKHARPKHDALVQRQRAHKDELKFLRKA